MDTMVKFKRLADLSTNFRAIMDALKNSELMEVTLLVSFIAFLLNYFFSKFF